MSENMTLVLDHSTLTVTLPKTYGRKQFVTLGFSDLKAITVEAVVSHRKGRVSYLYVPTLHAPDTGFEPFELIRWRDQRRARTFATWLSEQLGLPKMGEPHSRNQLSV